MNNLEPKGIGVLRSLIKNKKMDDNKVITIIFVAAMCLSGVAVIFGDSKENVKIEQEKTQQLIIQYKIDSLNAVKKEIK